jgi:hypothetical protein
MGDEKLAGALAARWAGVLSRLAAGPEDYGPHDTEQVCAALERTLDRAERAERERDEARRMLGECYVLSGADTDGNPPESIHVWPHAVQAVRELREDYDDELYDQSHRLCDAAREGSDV